MCSKGKRSIINGSRYFVNFLILKIGLAIYRIRLPFIVFIMQHVLLNVVVSDKISEVWVFNLNFDRKVIL